MKLNTLGVLFRVLDAFPVIPIDDILISVKNIKKRYMYLKTDISKEKIIEIATEYNKIIKIQDGLLIYNTCNSKYYAEWFGSENSVIATQKLLFDITANYKCKYTKENFMNLFLQ